jgi:KDO2-lipid IV(A) lauroyltransferase
MPSFRRRIRRSVYYGLAVALLQAHRILPRRAGRRLCAGTATLALRWRGRERERALANIGRVFPELDAAARASLLGEATAALGENLYDTLSLDRWCAEDFGGVEDEGVVAQLEALRAEGRGVLVLTGHFGCWELLGGYLARRLGGLAVVTGTIHNPPVDRLVNDWRRRAGLTPLPREGDLRPLLRTLQSGGAAAVLLDQNTRVENRVLSFCGHPAPTPTGFARLALRTGAAILPTAIARDGEGHVVRCLDPLRPGDYGGGDAEGDLLRDCNSALERILRRNPREWVWFHRRWLEEEA